MRKILHIFLSLVIVYAGTVSAYANTSVGGWSALDVITAGATNTINATKTAGGKVLNSAVTVGASVTNVGKHLIKGGGSVALAYAMVELVDAGIDWVLDPANNAVRYTAPVGDGAASGYPGSKYLYGSSSVGVPYAHPNAAAAAVVICEAMGGVFQSISASSVATCVRPDGSTFKTTSIGGMNNPNYNPAYNPNVGGDKYLPIEMVAAKVISNAEAGHGPSQEAVKSAALEGFAAGEHDAALDAAASEAGTDNPPDTADPNNPTDPQDPAVPFDPSSIIAAINALKALLAGILSSITGLADIFKEEPPPEKTQKETDVPVEVPPEVKNATEFDVDYIGFSSQCPTLSPFSVGIGAVSSSMTFDMTPLCELAVTIRPAIIAIAYFIGLGVIASAIRET